MWLRRVADRYSVPPTSLEHLTPRQLEHEVAILLADAAKEEARYMVTIEDRKERIALVARVRASGDWYDQIVFELYQQLIKKR